MSAALLLIPPHKKCTCCVRVFSRQAWRSLDLVGVQQLDDGVLLELRNCPCHTTLCVEVDLKTRSGWLEASGILVEMMANSHRQLQAATRLVNEARAELGHG